MKKHGSSRPATHFRFGFIGWLMLLVVGTALAGCGGPSKEEQSKQDEQGKQTNDAMMKRMMQEKGKSAAPSDTQSK